MDRYIQITLTRNDYVVPYDTPPFIIDRKQTGADTAEKLHRVIREITGIEVGTPLIYTVKPVDKEVMAKLRHPNTWSVKGVRVPSTPFKLMLDESASGSVR